MVSSLMRRRQPVVLRVPEKAPIPPGAVTGPEWSEEKGKIAAVQEAVENGIPSSAGAERQSVRISGGVPRWRDEPNFFGRDYLSGNPAENASTGMTSAISAMQEGQGSTGVHGGNLRLEEGEYRLTETLDLTRFTGRFGGNGPGISPSHGSTPGRGTVLRWDGPADQPMVRINNSRDVTFDNMRLEGKDGAPPSFAIECLNIEGDGAGTNQFFTFRDLVLGKYSWSTAGTYVGAIKNGIGFTGHNTNNDQFRMERVIVNSPLEYGLYLPNSQSVGGTARNLLVAEPGIACIGTAASVNLYDLEMYAYPLGIKILGSNTVVNVVGIRAEDGDTFAETWASGILSVRGGYIQVGDVIEGSEVFIEASPSDNLILSLEDLLLAENTDPAKALIRIGPWDGWPGRFQVSVRNCLGMHPSQLVFHPSASMWAGSPKSRGVVEWQTHHGNEVYQFRNELSYSGAGTREEINRSVWDMPVPVPIYDGVIGYTPGMDYEDAITAIPDLIVYYRLNEPSGTTASDSSGNDLHATTDGATVNQTGLLVGDGDTAYVFDGVDDAVSTAALPAFDLPDESFSVGFIYRSGSLPPADATFVGTSIIYVYCGSTGTFRAARTGSGALGATEIATNTTYRVVMTFDGVMIRLYVNGELDGTLAAGGSVASNDHAFVIGGYATGGDHAPGTIDEVFFAEAVLTQADVDLLELIATGGA